MTSRYLRMTVAGWALCCWISKDGLQAGAYRDAVLADSPVAYWGFEQTDPSQVAANLGVLGSVADGNYTSEGALLGQPTLVAGESDSSLRLSGAGRMSTAEFEKFSDVGGIGGTGFSVEFWTEFESLPGGFTNLVGDGQVGADFDLMVYGTPGGMLRPHLNTSAGVSAIDSMRTLAAGEIVHVVSTWDATSGDLKLYLDGTEAAATSIATALPNTGTPLYTDNPIYVGMDGREMRTPDAWLDEVAIYNYPLDPSRVTAHYDAGKGAPAIPLPQPYPDPGNLPNLPAGLITYIDFDEGPGPNATGGVNFAYDRVRDNDGSFLGNAARVPGVIGAGAVSLDNTVGTQVSLGPGTANDFSVTKGVTIEALIVSNWSGEASDYDEIFRKEDGGNRILLSFQNDSFGGGANPPVSAGPVLSFGLNAGGYGELDMPLNIDLSTLPGGNADSGTIWLLLPPDVVLGPNDVVLNSDIHHTVATYDQASGEKAIWIDGIKRWAVTLDGQPDIVSGGTAIASIGSSNGGENFNGVIDEFAFYDRALTPSEIATHVANVRAGGNYFVPEPSAFVLVAIAGLIVASGTRRHGRCSAHV